MQDIKLSEKCWVCIYTKGNDQGTRRPSLWGQAQGTGAIQGGEDMTLWESYSSLPVPNGGLQKSWRGVFHKGTIGRGRITSSWKRIDLNQILRRN